MDKELILGIEVLIRWTTGIATEETEEKEKGQLLTL